MVLKLALVSMDQEFELNSLDENLKQSVLLSPDTLNCCGEQRVTLEQHLQQHHQNGGGLQYPGVVHARILAGSTPGFSPDYHHPISFPPSPPSVAAVPGDNPAAMQPDGRTNLLEDQHPGMMWLRTQPLDLRSSEDMLAHVDLRNSAEDLLKTCPDDSWILRRVYGDMLTSQHGLDDGQHVLQQQHMQQPKVNICMNGYGGSVESVPGSSSSVGSFSASDDCDSLTDLPSPSFNQTNTVNGGQTSNVRNMLRIEGEVDGGLNDDQLIALSVRDLNRKLHGFPREVISRIKQKRRTLKNRGYAQNCRTKRIALKCLLEKNNQTLQMERDRLVRERETERQMKEKAIQECEKLIHERDAIVKERDFFKQQLQQLSREFNHQNSLSNGDSPDSPEFYI